MFGDAPEVENKTIIMDEMKHLINLHERRKLHFEYLVETFEENKENRPLTSELLFLVLNGFNISPRRH